MKTKNKIFKTIKLLSIVNCIICVLCIATVMTPTLTGSDVHKDYFLVLIFTSMISSGIMAVLLVVCCLLDKRSSKKLKIIVVAALIANILMLITIFSEILPITGGFLIFCGIPVISVISNAIFLFDSKK